MKSEQVILSELATISREWESQLQNHLRSFDGNISDYLLRMVAWICDVDESNILSQECTDIYITQVRWLYWYAYRYMTAEPYGRIAELARREGCSYTKDGVRKGVSKIASLMETSELWKRRWVAIKKVIKSFGKQNGNDVSDQVHEITITIPKELYEKIKVKIKKEE